MYEVFYGLSERPFNLTPDPRYLFLSEKHKEAFAHLMFGIKNRTGFVMVTGEIGTGKTTICRCLLNQLDADTEVAFIFNPYLSPEELLSKINEDFGIQGRAQSVKELIDELNQYLLDRAAHGKNCVLVIDESQDLKPGVLEQIRLLSNLETESQKLLQIVLIGQPELARNLQLDELRQLNQRITARYHLKPLNREETVQYVAYRLHVAGGRKKVHFTRGALRTIYRLSGGTPRVINAICDRALLIGYTREIHGLTTAVVRRAAKEIRGETVRTKGAFLATLRRFLPNPAWVGTVAAILVLVALFAPVWRWLRTPPPSTGTTAATIRQEPALPKETVAEHKPVAIATEPPPPTPEPKPSPAVTAEAPAPAPAPTSKPPDAPQPETAGGVAGMTAEALAKMNAAKCQPAAIAAIMRSWNMATVGGVPDSDTPDAMAAFAQASGLACETLNPTVEELVAIGLPALARIKTETGEAWIALIQVEGDRLRITTDAEPALVTKEVFRAVFADQAVVYWRDPNRNARVLRKGMNGEDVEQLQHALNALGRLPEAAKGEYDERTARAVAKLQADTGITIDGIAGKQIRMILSSRLTESPTPSLDEKQATMKRKAKHAKHPETPVAEAKAEKHAEPVTPAPETPKADTQEKAKPEEPKADTQEVPKAAEAENAVAAPAPAPETSAPHPGEKVGIEELAPLPHDDQLAPPKIEMPKEVTPPVTTSPPLVPRESGAEVPKEESQ